MVSRVVIVNADDFGMNRSANYGIVECHLAGAVSSTTMVANGDAFDEAVKLAAAHPSLAVGLHFNLTWGKPVAPASSVRALLDSRGNFLDRRTLMLRSMFHRSLSQEIRTELRAQYSRIRDAGISPTHVDSHQHVHGSPVIFSVVAEFCLENNLPVRVPWVRTEEFGSFSRRFRRFLLKKMVDHSVADWRGKLRWNDCIGSVFDLEHVAESLADDDYRSILMSAPGRCMELLVHPVLSAAEMTGYTRIGRISEAEYRYLRLGTLPSVIADCGFKLVTFRDLMDQERFTSDSTADHSASTIC
ncbi:MAG: chitooligosaccharide deacetylase [Pirellulaceae bacterium]|nr:MAG: chitooligosaccharide deacetylase [Pirellulaceae bacterium]